ncbi:MAG: M48 family metalloprotease, partial [Acetobacteraceae bacterium]
MRTLTALFAVAVLALAAPSFAQSPAGSTGNSQAPAASQPASQPQDTAGSPKAEPGVSTPATASATPSNSASKTSDKGPAKNSAKSGAASTAETDSIPSPGEDLDPHIKKGSEDDVNAIGTRNIGGRGLGNWFSTNWEVSTGKEYSTEIEKSAHLITDPVVTEYVNRIGQNIVKNSDCKVPFTIKVIDSDEINAMALPGGFFYVNSGLILAADDEAELAGVMAHETAHVCAHHAAREMTKMGYMEIGSIPLEIVTYGSWTGYG